MSTTESLTHRPPKKGATVILALIIAVVALVFLYDIFMSTRVKPIGQGFRFPGRTGTADHASGGFCSGRCQWPESSENRPASVVRLCRLSAGVAGAPIFKDATAWAP